MSLADVRHWVFDMDGTLTVAVHDFAAIRVALAIPAEDDILTHLAALPADEAAPSMRGCSSTSATWRSGRNRHRVRWSWCVNWPGAVIAWAFSRAMPVNWRMSRWRPLAWPTASRWRTCWAAMKRRPNRIPVVC